MPLLAYIANSLFHYFRIPLEQLRYAFTLRHLYGDNYFVKFVGSGGFPLFIVLGEDGLIRYMVNGTNEKIRQDILNVINKQ